MTNDPEASYEHGVLTLVWPKPDEVRKRIDSLFGGIPKVELFARRNSDGWDSWGG